jgi:hypothetical protein
MAGVLLLFGCVAGVLCTQALVISIQEEHEVVQLAQELVREEAKATVAVQTEHKAKQVAEAVQTVMRAALEVDAAQAEASGQALTLARTAQVLNNSTEGRAGKGRGGGGKQQRQQQKAEATSELAAAHSEVDRAVHTLESVTAALGATASRMRNESSKAAADGGAAAAQDQQLQALADGRVEQDERVRSDGDSNSSSDGGASGASSSTAADVAADGVAQDAAGAGAALAAGEAAAGSSASKGVTPHTEAGKREEVGGDDDDEVAEALEKVASSANDTLAAVRQSKVALEAASAEVATGKGKGTRAKVRTGRRRLPACPPACLPALLHPDAGGASHSHVAFQQPEQRFQ